MREPKYRCAKCGLGVIVVGDISKQELDVIKACTCDAPIAANLIAGIAGEGGVRL